MARFEDAIDVVLRHEGGFVDDPDDPGGATNWGISLRWLHGELGLMHLTADDVRRMTREEAESLYEEHWWAPAYASIRDQRIATKLLDMAVNMGRFQAHLLLQRALCELGVPVAKDGLVGEKTLSAVRAVDPGHLLGKLVAKQSDFYRELARTKPQMAKFLTGWLQRAAWPLNERSLE